MEAAEPRNVEVAPSATMQTGAPRAAEEIKAEHAQAGLAVMATAYGVGMALGFQEAAQGGYARIFGSEVHPGASGSVLVVAAVALLLLAVRFFWVPRSLYAYVLVGFRDKSSELTNRFARLMGIHFPIAVVHAILFYVACRLFEDVAGAKTGQRADHLLTELVFIYGGLLLLNGVWLASMTSRSRPIPGMFWASNNLLFVAAAAVTWFGILGIGVSVSRSMLCAIVLSVFVLNGAVDLYVTSPYYVLFDSQIPDGDKRALLRFVERLFLKQSTAA
jgi:hypothetical protein